MPQNDDKNVTGVIIDVQYKGQMKEGAHCDSSPKCPGKPWLFSAKPVAV